MSIGIEAALSAATALLGLLMALLKWNANQLVKRVEQLEREKAAKSEVSEVKELMREHREETREAFRHVNTSLTQILLSLRNGHRHTEP